MKYDFDLVLEEDNSLTKIIRQIDDNSKVLEFGPANGRMTKYLNDKKNCSMYFVEIDEDAAEDAKKYAKDYIVGDIEDYTWLEKWKDEKFDYITFADVLEHLRNPEEVLRKTKALLSESGKVIISVPNVAHNSLLINLHNNIFNYTPVGLLDNTHIHLFAYNTLVAVCNSVGYTITVEDAVYVPVGQNEVTASYDQVSKQLKNELLNHQYGNVYQFVFTLQKREYCIKTEVEIKKLINTHISDNYIKLYYDNGYGWSEDNSFSRNIRNRKDVVDIEFSFEGIERVKALRFDPLDDNCIIKIDKIELQYEEYSEELDILNLSTNANLRLESFFLYDTSDPQIYIPLKQGIIKFRIQYRYVEFMRDIYEGDFISSISKLINNFESEKRAYQNLLSKLENEKIQMDVVLNDLRLELNIAKKELTEVQEESNCRLEELNHRMEVINSLGADNAGLKNELRQTKENLADVKEKLEMIENTKWYKLMKP